MFPEDVNLNRSPSTFRLEDLESESPKLKHNFERLARTVWPEIAKPGCRPSRTVSQCPILQTDGPTPAREPGNLISTLLEQLPASQH
jgi:hypothetical protein